ncbi:hypothetical protein A2U01_0104649, partial [Trifolium medium]|nr:hypothetical protein [Trifolium medium]
EAKDLKKLSLESLISNLRSHEMVLNANAPQKNPKSVLYSQLRLLLRL